MSDDEIMVMDEADMDNGEAELLGAPQAFDANSGRIIESDAAADSELESFANSAGMIHASASASASANDAGKSVETWMHTLAEKNAKNTYDVKAAHMLGIDEAGRGPVLGSMVYGVCWCPVSKLDDLKNIKVADSKTLTFAQRENLFRIIQDTPWLGYEVDVISADRLSREMLRRNKVNLNSISHDSAIMLIQKVLDHGVNLREIYVDTVGDAGKYQEKLCGMFPGINITVSKKADSLYPVVSAASIAAKVTRDLNLEMWSFHEERPFAAPSEAGANSSNSGNVANLSAARAPNGQLFHIKCSRKLGSGYPGDPMTKVWLQNHLDPVFGYPDLVRFSWGTTKKILKVQAVQVEFGDEEEEEEEDGGEEEDGAQKLGKYFGAKEGGSGKKEESKSNSAASNAAAAEKAAKLVETNQETLNHKKFSAIHDSVTRKQYAIPAKERVGWFNQHHLEIATTF